MTAFAALYDLMLRTQFNRGRAATLGALGTIGVIIAAVLGSQSDVSTLDRVKFLDSYGLALVLPVTALVFVSAALGDLIDDQTMVYLALRPVARWRLALAAVLASLSIVVPLVAIPIVAAGAAIRLDARPIAGIVVSTVVGAVEYIAVFTALGVRVRRSLVVGLVFIFVWEQFVARASHSVRRFTISAYTRSILGEIAHVDLRDADMSLAASIIVPLAVAVVAFAYTARRLRTQDVA